MVPRVRFFPSLANLNALHRDISQVEKTVIKCNDGVDEKNTGRAGGTELCRRRYMPPSFGRKFQGYDLSNVFLALRRRVRSRSRGTCCEAHESGRHVYRFFGEKKLNIFFQFF